MTANAALCEEVANWAERYPEQHNQGLWLHAEGSKWDSYDSTIPIEEMRSGQCKTTACAAGIVTLLRAPEGTTVDPMDNLHFPDGTSTDICDFAAKELGLEDVGYGMIFYTSNETAIARLHYLAENPDATRTELEQAVPDPL